MIGSSMVHVALAFAVLGMGGGAADIGFVMAAYTVPTVAIALFGGAIADRFDRRRVMLLADILRMTSQGAIAALLLIGQSELWPLAVFAALTGMGNAFYIPATSGLIVESVSEANRPRANALYELASSVAFVLGPALAGVIVAIWSPAVAVTIDALSYLVSGICLFLLKPVRRQATERTTVVRQMRDGWKQFVIRPWIWGVLLQFTVFNILVFAPYRVLGPTQSEEWFGGSAGWGLIQSALGIGSVIGGIFMLRIRFKRPILAAILGQLAWAPVVAALGWSGAPLVLLMGLSLFAGIGVVVFNISWETSIQEQVPEQNLSSVNAYDWVISDVSLTVGLVLAGILVESVGAAALLFLGAVIHVITCLILLAFKQIRDLRSRERSEAVTLEVARDDTASK